MKMARWAFSLILAAGLTAGQLVAAESETKAQDETKNEPTSDTSKSKDASKSDASKSDASKSKEVSKSDASKSKTVAEEALDEEWLNTIWTQVDDIVKEKEYKLQATITVAGVRGAEAEDQVLDKLYYKGAKRYPSQDKLKKAIDVLRKSIAKNPKSADTPKQKYYVAQCYEKLGEKEEARDYYTQVTKSHSKTPWAAKAEKALKQLAPAK